jgi:hypothetical protein
MNESFNIPYNGENLECRPDNTSAFLFRAIGQQALRNHVFIVIDSEGDERRGICVFPDESKEQFDRVVEHMMNNDYTVHMNIQEVSETDEKIYQDWFNQRIKQNVSDLGDFIPDDFE